VADEIVERAGAHVSAELRHHSIMTQELMRADVPDEVLGSYLSLCAEAGPICQQARKRETEGYHEARAGRGNEVIALLNELQQMRADYAARESTLNEILNSKSFRLVSWCWRLRGRMRIRTLHRTNPSPDILSARG
jgi:hypothetical protein